MGFSFPRLAILQPAPLRKRLWQGGIALLIIVTTFTVGNFFVSQDKSVDSRMLGHDFLAFYTAGTFARIGQFDNLYNLDAVRDHEHAVARQSNLEIGPSFGPYWNPPFYAWLLAPFSAFPYRQALAMWTCMNFGFLAIAMALLVRMLPSSDWRSGLLVPLLICVSMPFIQAISHGQNTFMSLLLLTIVVTAWRKQMPVVAGAVCGLMLYKPQLAVVVAGMLVLTMGWRVLLGMGSVGTALLLVSLWTMPNAIANYMQQLPIMLRYMQIERAYLWERHVTLKAFWRLLFQGREAGEISIFVNLLTVTCAVAIGAGLFTAWRRKAELDRLIVATILAMPLLMPFYFDYDLLLLSVPAVLVAGEAMNRNSGSPLERTQRLMIGAWIAMYLWFMLNPPLASASRVNVTVVLLGTICALAIRRALQRETSANSVTMVQPQHVAVRRTA